MENVFVKKDFIKLLLSLTVFYSVWKIIKYLNFLWLFNNGIPIFDKVIDPNEYLAPILIDWLVVILFMGGVAYLVGNWMNHSKIGLGVLIVLHLVLSIFLGFIIFPVLFLIYWMDGRFEFNSDFWKLLLDRVIKYMDINFLTYFSMLGIILLFYYFKNIEYERKKKAILESKLLETRLMYFNSQLEPHFIFNVLNGVSSLIDEDRAKAKRLLVNFADMLRNVLHKKKAIFTTLGEELKALDNYIQILKIRFEEDLSIFMHLEEAMEHITVPSLLIQPIVENAVKHGYGYKKKELEVHIKIEKKEHHLFIYIYNNGVPLDFKNTQEKGQGNGLRNLSERLKMHYGEMSFFEIRNAEDGSGVENLLLIPIV